MHNNGGLSCESVLPVLDHIVISNHSFMYNSETIPTAKRSGLAVLTISYLGVST